MAQPPEQPTLVRDGAHLFALCGFAIAQPLFDLLGNNPTFFIAHDLSGLGLVVVALALVIVPPLLLLAILWGARLASASVARVVRALVAGGLISLTILPPLDHAVGLSTATWFIAGAVFLVAAAWLYDRFVNMRTFMTYLTPAPILFLVIFLFISPASALVTSSDPSAADVDIERSNTPVVVVVFDEFSLPLLLDEHGNIDSRRFPGFARLAASSTWYPNATTNRNLTQYAVPAIEAGILRKDRPIALASVYPRSIFTALGRSHTIHATEPVTALCPDELCAQNAAPSSRRSSLPKDLGVVFLRQLLPDKTADKFGVPMLGDRWAGFEAAPKFSSNGVTNIFQIRPLDEHDVDSRDQEAGYERFLRSLGTGQEPGLWFHHVLLPHVPHSLLPGGYAYTPRYLPDGKIPVAADPLLAELDAQRLMLQTMRVDELMNELLDRLDATGLSDDAMVVVTADHGSSFVAGRSRRDTTPGRSLDGLMPVPLFVKYPGEHSGRVDRRDARTVDVLPTIVDALHIDLPKAWKFDGRSLATASPGPERPETMNDVEVPRARPRREVAELAKFLSTSAGPHDGYRLGPFGDLVGVDASSLGQTATSGSAQIDNAGAYETIDLHGIIPALFEATVTGVDPGDWVAISLNGTIAGVGPAYAFQGAARVAALLDPAFMRNGANEITVYRVLRDGKTLQPLG